MRNLPRRFHFVVCALGLVVAFSSGASAEDGASRTQRLDRKGDRIEARLDRRGDRIERRGERVNRRLDKRGHRIDERLDRRGERVDGRLDRRAGGAADGRAVGDAPDLAE